MAVVYLARDIELDRAVAVKLLAENLAGDPSFEKRFVREARLAARLSHPNVVSVYDAGEDGGRPYIVMEYVEGETLADLLARRGRIPPDEARGLALQAANGLAHAHAAGLVHRDVKPQNLILRGDGTLKIADFGIARAAEATALTQAGTVLGTAAYLSPEQALGEEVGPAADVYSLGAVLYELLTGRPPFELESLDDSLPPWAGRRSRRCASSRPRCRRSSRTSSCIASPGTPTTGPRTARRSRRSSPVTRMRATQPLARGQTRVDPVPASRPSDRRYVWLALAGVLTVAAICSRSRSSAAAAATTALRRHRGRRLDGEGAADPARSDPAGAGGQHRGLATAALGWGLAGGGLGRLQRVPARTRCPRARARAGLPRAPCRSAT